MRRAIAESHTSALCGRALRAARSAALASACLLALGAGTAGAAGAAPTDVTVRIVGLHQTLFEGPVLTEGHQVQPSGESVPHKCDGTNNKANPAPGPTPTASADDAVMSVGATFNARWFPGLEDFLVTEWAGERESEGNSWTVLVNGTSTSIGGCQYELGEGAQVLWAFGPPPRPKQLLALYPQGSPEGAPPLTAVAKQGIPLALEALSLKPGSGSPPATQTRAGFAPFAAAQVVPVQTAANGAETPLTEQVLAASDEAGHATVTFTTPGWHRLMAVAPGTVRSNRLDVCVCAPSAPACGQAPAEDEPRSAGHTQAEPPTLPCSAAVSTTTGSSPTSPNPGPGASGTPSGSTQSYSAVVLRVGGHVLTAHGALWTHISYRGRWRRRRAAAAVDGYLMAGSRGARAEVRLGPGRPVFALLAAGASARVELRAGGSRRVVLLRRAKAGPTLVELPALRHAAPVSLRVLGGTAELDAVATAPAR